MKFIRTEKELYNYLNLDKNGIKFLEEEINNFLNCEGTDIVENENDKPKCLFDFEYDDIKCKIGITSIEIEEDEYKNLYWIENN